MKKTKKFNSKFKIITLLTLFLSILGVIFTANYFSTALYMGAELNHKTLEHFKEVEIYVVSLAKTQNINSATVISKDYEDINASGYIWQIGDYYHIVYNIYETENESKLVKENLEKQNIECNTIKIKLSGFVINEEVSTEEHNIIQESVNSFFYSYRIMKDASVGKEKNVYDDNTINEKLKNLKNKVETLVKKFNDTFKTTVNNKIITLGEYLADELESIMLTSSKNIDLKYHAIEILDIYKNMSIEFS